MANDPSMQPKQADQDNILLEHWDSNILFNRRNHTE